MTLPISQSKLLNKLIGGGGTGLTPSTNKKIRARPLGQQVVQSESDLKPEFKLKVSS